MSKMNLVSLYLTSLTADRNVSYPGIRSACIFIITFGFETFLIVQKHDEFALQPFSDFFFSLAETRFSALTHLELDGKLLCSD